MYRNRQSSCFGLRRGRHEHRGDYRRCPLGENHTGRPPRSRRRRTPRRPARRDATHQAVGNTAACRTCPAARHVRGSRDRAAGACGATDGLCGARALESAATNGAVRSCVPELPERTRGWRTRFAKSNSQLNLAAGNRVDHTRPIDVDGTYQDPPPELIRRLSESAD